MAALTPEEREHSTQIYRTYAYFLEDGPEWSSGMRPLQVVRKAFDSIRVKLSNRYVAEEFDEYLLNEETKKNNRYDVPTGSLDRPLAWDGMTRIAGGTQADQDKLDRAIYDILVGNDLKEAPAKVQGRDLTSVKRVGLSKNLPEDVESVIGSYITGKKGSTKSQMDQLRQATGESLAPQAGRRTKKSKRRGRKTRRNRK